MEIGQGSVALLRVEHWLNAQHEIHDCHAVTDATAYIDASSKLSPATIYATTSICTHFYAPVTMATIWGDPLAHNDVSSNFASEICRLK